MNDGDVSIDYFDCLCREILVCAINPVTYREIVIRTGYAVESVFEESALCCEINSA